MRKVRAMEYLDWYEKLCWVGLGKATSLYLLLVAYVADSHRLKTVFVETKDRNSLSFIEHLVLLVVGRGLFCKQLPRLFLANYSDKNLDALAKTSQSLGIKHHSIMSVTVNCTNYIWQMGYSSASPTEPIICWGLNSGLDPGHAPEITQSMSPFANYNTPLVSNFFGPGRAFRKYRFPELISTELEEGSNENISNSSEARIKSSWDFTEMKRS